MTAFGNGRPRDALPPQKKKKKNSGVWFVLRGCGAVGPCVADEETNNNKKNINKDIDDQRFSQGSGMTMNTQVEERVC